jgi:hypothetical protein
MDVLTGYKCAKRDTCLVIAGATDAQLTHPVVPSYQALLAVFTVAASQCAVRIRTTVVMSSCD